LVMELFRWVYFLFICLFSVHVNIRDVCICQDKTDTHTQGIKQYSSLKLYIFFAFVKESGLFYKASNNREMLFALWQ
jgi:hypothetical protein